MHIVHDSEQIFSSTRNGIDALVPMVQRCCSYGAGKMTNGNGQHAFAAFKQFQYSNGRGISKWKINETESQLVERMLFKIHTISHSNAEFYVCLLCTVPRCRYRIILSGCSGTVFCFPILPLELKTHVCCVH